VNPAAGKMTGQLFLWAAPGHDRWGDVSWGAHEFLMNVGMESPAVKFTASYGDPFPPAWGRLGSVYFYYQVPITVPGASTPGELTARIHFNDVAAKFTGPIHPTLTPPREPKIDGRSAFTEVLGTGATPLVSWSPPQIGTPEIYKVFVYRARVSDGRVLFDYLSVLYSAETSVRLPPDLLQFGESYVLVLEALIEDGVRVNKPFNRAAHRNFAQAVTARFSP